MHTLIIAEHPQFGKVRTIENERKMWFCAADVAQALGYVNSNDTITRHCKTKGVELYDIPTAGGRQKVKFIDEGNLRLSAGEKGGDGRRTAFTRPDVGGKQTEGA